MKQLHTRQFFILSLALSWLVFGLCSCAPSVESIEPELQSRRIAAFRSAGSSGKLTFNGNAPRTLDGKGSIGHWYQLSPGFNSVKYRLEIKSSQILSTIDFTQSTHHRIGFLAEAGVAYQIRHTSWLGPGHRIQVWIENAANGDFVAGVKPTKVGGESYYYHRECNANSCSPIYICEWEEVKDYQRNLGRGCYLDQSNSP